MQTTKPVREFVFLGIALGTTGFTLLPFVLFRAAAFLPVGIGIYAGTFKFIYIGGLAISLTAGLGALICSSMRLNVRSALVSFAPVAVLILFAYSLFGLALFDIR